MTLGYQRRKVRGQLQACSRKHTYGSWEAAARVAKQMRRRTEARVAPYRCHICQKFHIGGTE